MFDGMPAQKRAKKNARAPVGAVVGGAGRIGALPDPLLHHVLSFLPAEEAVRTCVLAHRWRYLWKSAPGLRIGCLRDNEPVSVTALRKFVDSLLLLRGGSPLNAFELRIDGCTKGDDEERANLWFRYAVALEARVLKINVQRNRNNLRPWLLLDNLPLVSKHLLRPKLHSVWCHTRFLDFATCPALEHLELELCDLSLATKISSESLKILSITGTSFSLESRLRIYVPNLVSLHLDNYCGTTPILESIPSLAEAYVKMTRCCNDRCDKLDFECEDDCGCEYYDSGAGSGDCVLLKGLSKAKKLVLSSDPQMFIFKQDLRCCPTFSNLKTLLLNDYWCVGDHSALACVLEHSPILEKLTLHLGRNHKMEMKGSFHSMERSTAISEHLKIVEIKFEVVDVRVFKVLKFQCTFNISFTC